MPVGFKWFVDGLLDGSLGFGGEESAGASFLRRDGTRLDHRQGRHHPGPARGRDHGAARAGSRALYRGLARELGDPVYERIDAPATPEQKARLKRLSPERLRASELAGEPIQAMLTTAPGNGAPIGGLKVVTASGWFAARPSGTEDVYKIYAESFRGRDHLRDIQRDAERIVAEALAPSGAGQ